MKHFISLGAGVQSSAMALMASKGEITPMPEAAIFADTQAEPASVYRWLDWLETQLPFPVVRVSKGNLTAEALRMRNRKADGGAWTKSLLPVYTLESNGKKGHMQRACTYDYKVMQILKAQRRLGGVKRGQKTVSICSWIGISADEALRMKDSKVAWAVNRYPLVDAGITRNDCMEWMHKHGFPPPPRSACVYCPFHSDREWLRLKNEEPLEFLRAVEFEAELQRTKASTCNMRGVPFLHASRVPLSDVVFADSANEQLFINECEGMCGV